MQNLKFGGAERILITFLKNFDRDKYHIELVLHTKEGALIKEVPSDVKIVSLVPLNNGSLINKMVRTIFFRLLKHYPIALKFFFRFLFSRADVTVAFMEGITTNIASLFSGARIAWVHTDVSKNPWADKFFKSNSSQLRIYQKYDRIVFVSLGGKSAFSKKFSSVSTSIERIIHNPINSDEVYQKSSVQSNEVNSWMERTAGTIKLISVGRLDAVKRLDILINAVYEMNDINYPVTLTIIGDGQEKEKLEKLHSNSANKVLFLGAKKNPMPYVVHSQLFVSTSAVESYPTAIVEALILGTPVLATDNAGSKEVLGNDEKGKIVQASISSNDLASEIDLAIKNRDTLAAKAQSAKNSFNIETILKQYDNIFEEAIKAHGF